MKIGINLIALPAEQGGGPFRHIKLMMQALGEYSILNCEFVIYKQKQIGEEYLEIPSSLNVKYINVPNIGSGIKRILFEQTFFYKYIEPCDVLYSYCTSMPLLAKCKKVFTLHDVYFLTTKERYGWLQRTYLKYVTKLYCRCCNDILTVSKFSFDEIIRFLGVNPCKLHLTYNFVFSKDTKVIKPKKIKDVNGLNVDTSRPYFLYVGNLQPGKNIKGMIDGFIKYSEHYKDYQLIIAGKPTTYGNEMVSYLKGYNNIHYLGYQSRETVEYLQANCICIVLLSFCEGFGIPPIEGFAYGRPALVSNRTSLPEVVGKAGIIVDPYNIDDITKGFEKMQHKCDDYCKYIPEQLAKFNSKISTETFMETLGITYIRIKN